MKRRDFLKGWAALVLGIATPKTESDPAAMAPDEDETFVVVAGNGLIYAGNAEGFDLARRSGGFE